MAANHRWEESRRALLAEDSTGRRAVALSMVAAALEAVEPARVTREVVAELVASGELNESPVVIALGKAAMGMARGALDVCRPKGGLLVGLDVVDVGGVAARRAEHPASGAVAIANGEALIRLGEAVGAEDVVLCLVSGGGSAMADVPADGIDAACLLETQRALLASGAPIEVVNAIRARLSRFKGGGLLGALLPARVITVVLSDTPRLTPALVASGPTVPPPSGPSLGALLAMPWVTTALPPAAVAALRRSDRGRAARARLIDRVASPGSCRTVVAADNDTAVRAAVSAARARGLTAAAAQTALAGEARQAGERLCLEGRRSEVEVLVAGGETTVVVQGQGRGGRSHELCLGGADHLAGGLLVAFGTDGVDGTSGAAGAMLDDEIMSRATALGLGVREALAANDSAAYFEGAGGQITTGPTGTNVADLAFYLR